jgi:hypothetical protein
VRAMSVPSLVTGLVVALGAAGCGSPSGTGEPAGSGPLATAPPPSTSVSATATTPGSSHTATAWAAGQLAAFFTTASRQDAQLRAAARLINAGIGSTAIILTHQTKAAVDAIDPAVLARTIPAGLDPAVELAVLLVYSELDSRRQAMNRVSEWALTPGTTVLPKTQFGGGIDLLGCLANGAPAAARFSADLAKARVLATQTTPAPPTSPQSRTAADLAVRIALAHGANRGCASCGGQIVTTLEPVAWQPVTVAGIHWDGVIGATSNQPNSGIRFQARYSSGKGWQIQLNAC